MLDRHLVGQLHGGHDPLDHRGVEPAHQVVAEGEVEAGLPGVPLTPRPAAQLVVDPPGLVPLRAEHVQAPRGADLLGLGLGLRGDLLQHLRPGGLVLLRVLDRVEAAFPQHLVGDDVRVPAEHDVGPAARHVGGHRDRALPAGLRDDQRFAVVLLGVQHLVRHVALDQRLRQELRLLHAGRTDQHGLTLLVTLGDVVRHGLELRRLALVDEVGLVGADHRFVGGDLHHTELVRLVELGRLRLGGTGHPGELVVEAEVVLQRDRGQGLVLGLDLDAFLGLDRLVHPLVEPATGQDPAGELVDDEHLATPDDVLLVLVVELLGLQGVVQEADQRGVRRLVEVVDTELVLDELHAGLRDAHGPLALVHLVVDVLGHQRRHPRELVVPARRLVRGTGDDQRRPGLVDEDGVDLVDDGVVVPALHTVVEAPRHVVAEVVEAELVVRAVGDVGPVGLPACGGLHVRADHPHLEPEEPVDTTHPLGVPLGEVVVGGDDVDTPAGERVEVDRQHTGQGLALTGLHLRGLAEVECGTAHELDVEVPLAEHPLRRLADHRERLREKLVQRLAVGVARAELVGLRLQVGVREVLDVVFEGVDLGGDAVQPLHRLALARAEQAVQKHRVDLTCGVVWASRHTRAGRRQQPPS